MRSLTILVGGAVLGAGAMYLLDPERGPRRRAELREALAGIEYGELVDRARRLEPLEAVRGIAGGRLAAVAPMAGRLGSRGRRWAPALTLGRRRPPALQAWDWALLGGLAGALVAGFWLMRRAAQPGEDIEVTRSMTVEAPVERVFELWSDFENFPRFMSHVREVRRTGPDRTHWVVAGPAGTPVEWDAVVTRRTPNEEISWRTVEGALIEHAGTVRFRPAGSSATRVDVHMTYRPAGGEVGRGLAALLGGDPERLISDDLARMSAQLRGARPAAG
jgi:uncharacterized membrane protein